MADDALSLALDRMRARHTSQYLTRATDGHPLCDEDEEIFPCETMAVVAEVERLQARARAADGLAEALRGLQGQGQGRHTDSCGGWHNLTEMNLSRCTCGIGRAQAALAAYDALGGAVGGEGAE